MTTTESSGDVFRDLGVQSPIEALAESWATMDGKGDLFIAGKAADDEPSEEVVDCYVGYMDDAKEMIERLSSRGYVIVPTKLALS